MWKTFIKITLVAEIVAVVVIWHRFMGWGFVEPIWKTGIKLPLIPLLGGGAAFLWLFFDKGSVFERFRDWIDVRVGRWGLLAVSCGALLVLASHLICVRRTPPMWEKFVDYELLNGHGDQFFRANVTCANLLTRDQELGLIAEIAVRLEELSEEESKWDKLASSQDELHVHQKRIETVRGESGYVEVLRCLSIANLATVGLDHETISVEQGTESAIGAYAKLEAMPRRYTTAKLRLTAMKGRGNALFFADRVEDAVEVWCGLPPSPGTMANLVAGYRLLGDLDKSISVGLEGLKIWNPKARNSAQTLGSLVVNTMTSMAWMEDYPGAAELFESWYPKRGIVADSAALQLYAFVLILGDRLSETEQLVSSGKFDDDAAKDVRVLQALANADYSGALALLRDRRGKKGDKLPAPRLWEDFRAEVDHAGYLGIPKLAGWLDWGTTEAANREKDAGPMPR